ncbi:VWA domain-containing protein [Frigidibacter sp. SD6-1]|uniref:vWA domain-containing protein n=1 Tax=Frigidibacter sp. SD6-1 TaxID=3032581 RepID=UPI0024E01567|nr:VWA domain-containing protein [Frigidibacter sp. SD6-1]
MTDDLDDLRKALRAVAPAPDPAAKAAALARAMEAFDANAAQAREAARQESADQPRPTSDRPRRAGFLTGVRKMLSKLTSRPMLAATASVAAICVGVVITQPGIWQRPDIADTGRKPAAEQAPSSQSAAVAADTQIAPPPADDRARQTAVTTAEAPAPEADAPLAAPPALIDQVADEPAVVAEEEMSGDAQAEGLARMPKSAEADPNGMTAYFEAAPASNALSDAAAPSPEPNTETFSNDTPNPVKIVAEEPVSTFSTDVDTASWSVVRSSVMNGYLPPAEAVRIEEMVNYFPYSYPAPEAGGAPFLTEVSLFQTPWNKDTQLLRIGLQGRLPAIEERPALDLVFLIDTSGSMEDANKLPLLIQSFRLMLGQLRPEDRVAIVTYAGSAGLVLEPTEAKDRAKIEAALGRLGAGGSTAGAEGLELAYQTAESMKGEGRIGRILLATDGDFNVGVSDPEGLESYVARKRESGTYLSVLGFGRGNLDDATMQSLAQNGNGTAAYIDTLAEAQKVLVDQLTGALFPIADDVKVQVEFNPAAVAEYRLIGYETRALAREDFNNDKVDAGEIGAGLQVTAFYEVTPVGSPARLSDPLRYGAQPDFEGDIAELGFLKLRYKDPGETLSKLIEQPIPPIPGEADEDARFAAAIAGMGQLLSEPKYLGGWGWDDAIALANGAKGADPYGYRAGAVQIMRLAQSLRGN